VLQIFGNKQEENKKYIKQFEKEKDIEDGK